jgi:hypothetical protein
VNHQTVIYTLIAVENCSSNLIKISESIKKRLHILKKEKKEMIHSTIHALNLELNTLEEEDEEEEKEDT